jgi:hypothetical protein
MDSKSSEGRLEGCASGQVGYEVSHLFGQHSDEGTLMNAHQGNGAVGRVEQKKKSVFTE